MPSWQTAHCYSDEESQFSGGSLFFTGRFTEMIEKMMPLNQTAIGKWLGILSGGCKPAK